jgi:hypothetical protein
MVFLFIVCQAACKSCWFAVWRSVGLSEILGLCQESEAYLVCIVCFGKRGELAATTLYREAVHVKQ